MATQGVIFEEKRMSVRVRFAPSPTGPLHIGGLRTALYNYLFAKKNGGKFLLRIEDTDQNRKVEGAEDYIINALKWCDLKPDEGPLLGGEAGPYRQSERKKIYKEHIDLLIREGKAYYAFDSPEELSKARLDAEGKKTTFKYDAHNRLEFINSLSRSSEETKSLLETTAYVVRLKVDPKKDVQVNDKIRGKIEMQGSEIDDKILMKADGMPTYHFANVVDDHSMGITHVIRGEEWLPSLALHQLIYDAFGWIAPIFMHLPLILKPQGKGKLSKRDGEKMGFPVYPLEWQGSKGFKERGFLPEALVNYLALLGWNPGTEKEIFSFQELQQIFDTDKIQKGGAKFDFDKAKWVNHKFIELTEEKAIFSRFNEFTDHLPSEWSEKKRTAAYALVKKRLFLLEDLISENRVFLEDPEEYDPKVLKKLKGEEPQKIILQFIEYAKKDIPAKAWKEKIQGWNEERNYPFGIIMQSLRLALVGNLSGPDVFDICYIIGNKITLRRLEKILTHLN